MCIGGVGNGWNVAVVVVLRREGVCPVRVD